MSPTRGSVACLAAAMVLWGNAAAASTMRCDGGVVGVGDSEAAVLARCGEPHHRAEHQRESRTADGRIDRVTDVKIWTYRRGYGRFVLLLTFEGGRMIRIDRGDRQETR